MYWGALSLLYLFLTIQTARWYRKLKKSVAEGGDVQIGSGMVHILGPEDQPNEAPSISLLGMLKGIRIADIIGFL